MDGSLQWPFNIFYSYLTRHTRRNITIRKLRTPTFTLSFLFCHFIYTTFRRVFCIFELLFLLLHFILFLSQLITTELHLYPRVLLIRVLLRVRCVSKGERVEKERKDKEVPKFRFLLHAMTEIRLKMQTKSEKLGVTGSTSKLYGPMYITIYVCIYV